MQKRAQSALEFMMTYGWMIIVVLTSIMALAYFGVINFYHFLPDGCVLSEELTCTSSSIGPKNIVMLVTNTKDYALKNLKINSTSSACSSKMFTMNPRETIRIGLDGINCNLTKYYNTKLQISYVDNDGLAKAKKGKVFGAVGPGNLVLHYSFDNNKLEDTSGFRSNPVYIGGISTSSNCPSGSCISMTGAAGSGIKLENTLKLRDRDVSIEAYVKTSSSDAFNKVIFLKGRAQLNNDPSIGIFVNNGKLRALIGTGITTFAVSSTSNINDNNWHKVQAVFKRNGKLKVYVDGVDSTSVDTNINAAGHVDDLNIPPMIGANPGDSNNLFIFSGSMDELKVYDYAII